MKTTRPLRRIGWKQTTWKGERDTLRPEPTAATEKKVVPGKKVG